MSQVPTRLSSFFGVKAFKCPRVFCSVKSTAQARSAYRTISPNKPQSALLPALSERV